MRMTSQYVVTVLALFALMCGSAIGAETTDTLNFGDSRAEEAHDFKSINSEVRTGARGQKCRVMLPQEPPIRAGGSMTFTVSCDPEKQNYLTLKLWGGEQKPGYLYLYDDQTQVGRFKLSDWSPLVGFSKRPGDAFPGRFFYVTVMIPRSMTRGKTEVELRIVSMGYWWNYGHDYWASQQKQEEPSRALYRAYSHQQPFTLRQ